MEQNIKDKILFEKNKLIKKNRNIFLKVFLTVFIGGYLFFFLSNSWYPPDYKSVHVTKLNTTLTQNDREVTLLDWTYSKKQKQMEVEIQIENKAFDGRDKYEWSALDKKKGALKVVPVVETDNYVVLHIDVPERWTIISLRMNMKDSKNDMLKLYTHKRAVAKTDKIETLTLKEYMISRQDKVIKSFEETITSDQKKIEANQKKIVKMIQDISQYQDDQKYQTENQKEESSAAISTLENQKQTLEDENVKLQEDIEEMHNRVEKANLKKQEYQ